MTHLTHTGIPAEWYTMMSYFASGDAELELGERVAYTMSWEAHDTHLTVDRAFTQAFGPMCDTCLTHRHDTVEYFCGTCGITFHCPDHTPTEPCHVQVPTTW